MARLLLSNNPAESFEWLQKAANQGHAGAQSSLGQMYTRDQYFSSFNAYDTIPPADIPQDYAKGERARCSGPRGCGLPPYRPKPIS